MHNGDAEMTTDQKSKPEVNLRDVIKWKFETYVRRCALIDVIDEIYSSLDNKEYVMGIYLDLKKSIWHSGSQYFIMETT